MPERALFPAGCDALRFPRKKQVGRLCRMTEDGLILSVFAAGLFLPLRKPSYMKRCGLLAKNARSFYGRGV